jgi:NADH:ubiquinone oxidoreductase subunit 2 (subunit N)
MDLLVDLRSHVAELILLVLWIALHFAQGGSHSKSNANRRLAQLGLIVIAILCVTRLGDFSAFNLATGSSTLTFGEWMVADRLGALYQLLLAFTAFAAVKLRPKQSDGESSAFLSALVGVVACGSIALSSFHLATTFFGVCGAVIFASQLNSNSAKARDTDVVASAKLPRAGLLIFGFGLLSLAVSSAGLGYRQIAIATSQGWLDETLGGQLAAWAMLSVGLLMLGRALLSDVAQTQARSQQLMASVGIPVLMFGVWLRLTTSMYSGLVQGSPLNSDGGALQLLQNLIFLVAALCLIFGAKALKNASGCMAQLAACTPIHVALLLAASFSLGQSGVEMSGFYAVIYTLAGVGAWAGLGLRSRWAALLWTAVILAWVGLPPTAGMHVRWAIGQELLAGGHLWLAILIALSSLWMLLHLVPHISKAFDAKTSSPGSRLLLVACGGALLWGFASLRLLSFLPFTGQDAVFW